MVYSSMKIFCTSHFKEAFSHSCWLNRNISVQVCLQMDGGVQTLKFYIAAILIAESMTLYKPGSHPSPAITMSCCSLRMWLLFLSHWGLRKREKCTTVWSHEGESVRESHTLYIYLLMMSPSHKPSAYSFSYNHPHWLFMKRSWIAGLYHFVFASLIGAIKESLFRLVLLTVC